MTVPYPQTGQEASPGWQGTAQRRMRPLSLYRRLSRGNDERIAPLSWSRHELPRARWGPRPCLLRSMTSVHLRRHGWSAPIAFATIFVHDRPVQLFAQQAGKLMAFSIKSIIRDHRSRMMQRFVYPGFQSEPQQRGNPYFLPLHPPVRKPERRSAVVWIEPSPRHIRSSSSRPPMTGPPLPARRPTNPKAGVRGVHLACSIDTPLAPLAVLQ